MFSLYLDRSRRYPSRPLVCRDVGEKGFWGQEPEVDDFRWQRGRAPTFSGKVVRAGPLHSVLISSLGADWLPRFLLTVLTQRLGRRISFTAALENDFITQMHELLFTKNILFSS